MRAPRAPLRVARAREEGPDSPAPLPSEADDPLAPLLLEAMAPLGRALRDHHRGDAAATLVVHVEGQPPELLPAAYFFRLPAEMGPVDARALELARGRVLDIGAGAGAHAVPLVERGLSVTALEVVPEAVEVLRARGVEDARLESLWTLRSDVFWDTVMVLMNGTSVAGTPSRLAPLLERLGALAAPGGQVLIDSTTLGDGDGTEAPEEVHYQLEYRGERGPPFPQLFVDEVTLARAAHTAGWAVEVEAREGERYLARLVREATTG